MSAHRTHRSDSNAEEIVNAFRGCGASVLYLNRAGGRRGGQPDLLVGIDSETFLVEIKLPKAKLTPDQIAWHAGWRGAPVHVIRSLEDVGVLVAAVRTSRSGDANLWAAYEEIKALSGLGRS